MDNQTVFFNWTQIDAAMLVAAVLALFMLVGFSLLGWLIIRLDRAYRLSSGKNRDYHQLQRDLAVMADSVQRFLVWTRFHGLVGEIDFARLRLLYEEFCQLTGDKPEDNQVLAKRLEQCGCDKPPLRWMKDAAGKRTCRKQFYIIPDRHEAATLWRGPLQWADIRGANDDSRQVSGKAGRGDTAQKAHGKRATQAQGQFSEIAA